MLGKIKGWFRQKASTPGAPLETKGEPRIVLSREDEEAPKFRMPWFTCTTASEALSVTLLAPVKQILRRVIRPVSRTGIAPESQEEWWLDPEQGQIIRRTEFLLVDDNGMIRDARRLAAVCFGCGAPIFEAMRCPECGRMHCRNCLNKFEDAQGQRQVCKPCHRRASWHKENWLEFDANQKGGGHEK